MAERESVQRMFSAIARRYDVLNHLLSLGMDRYWWSALARLAVPNPGLFILDVAAGTGDSSLRLTRRGARVVCLDLTLAMLHYGRRERPRAGWQWIQGDALSLPFRDATFDGLTMAFGLRNFEERSRAYQEFHRVLKPGGRIVILEFSHPPSRFFRWLYSFYSRTIIPCLGQWISRDPQAYRYLPDSIRAFPDPEALAQELVLAGFQEVHHRNLTLGICCLHWARTQRLRV